MKKIQLHAKIIFPLCILILSLVYLFLGKKFNLGTMKRPGVGFLPMVSGTLLMGFSLFQVIKEIKLTKGDEKLDIKWWRIFLFFSMVILYAVILKPVGYVIATSILLFLSARLYGAKSWLKPLVFSFLMSGISYYIFAVVLLVQLP